MLLGHGGPLFGWAKPVPVATKALRNPRCAMVMVALAGPAANLVMAFVWCLVLAAGRCTCAATRHSIRWMVLMAQAGILINVRAGGVQPAADSAARRRPCAGRLCCRRSGVRGWRRSSRLGFFIVLGLSALGMLGWLFEPAYPGGRPRHQRPVERAGMSGPMQNRRVLSGMRPTGMLHLGNYHGALQELDRAAVPVRVLFLHRRLACAHHRLRGHLASSRSTSGRWRSTGSRPG